MPGTLSLVWRGCDVPSDRFFVKGTILATAYVPGTLSRFLIREVRGGRDEHGFPTLRYGLSDASTVSDAEVREGKGAKVVYWSDEPDQCLAKAAELLRK